MANWRTLAAQQRFFKIIISKRKRSYLVVRVVIGWRIVIAQALRNPKGGEDHKQLEKI